MKTRIMGLLITVPFLFAVGIAGPVWAETQSEVQKLNPSDASLHRGTRQGDI